MDIILGFFKNFVTAWPSILMGALIPCAVLLIMLLGKKRAMISFKPVAYGFASFFAGLIFVAVLLLIVAQFFFPSISTSAAADANGYILAGGIVVLVLFYLATEALKYFSFRSALASEKPEGAGLTFGCGFILAQNLLIVGLLYGGEMDMLQMIGFGILMLISGVIYLLISAGVTYLIRMLPLVLVRKKISNRFIRSFL